MKIEEKIQKMKQIYVGTTVSDEVVMKEWQMLENVLGKQQKTYVSPLFFRAFAFAAVTLLLSGGVVSLAQASKPGEFLYPVKEISQKVVEKVKKSAPVFTQPDQNIKGATDTREENTYDEKNEDQKSNDVKGHSSTQKEQKIEIRSDDNNNSGSDNKGQNNKSKSEKKEGSHSTSSGQVGQSNSSQGEKGNSKSQGNSHKK